MNTFKIAAHMIDKHLPVIEIASEPVYYDAEKDALVVGGYHDPNDYGFMRHLMNIHRCRVADKYGYNLWHLLHEIGHYKIKDKWGDNLQERAYFKENFRYLNRNIPLQNEFYNMRVEWEATEWAIKWVEANPKKAALLNKILRD